RRHGNDPLCKGVIQQGLVRVYGLIPDDEFVIHIFGRNIHEREIESAFIGMNILFGNGVNMLLYVADELFPGCPAIVLAGRFDNALEVFERKFCVYRDKAAAEPDDSVHSFPALEPMLKRKVRRRKYLGKQVAQKQLAKAASKLG